MTELAVLAVLCSIGIIAVLAIVIRVGRTVDRDTLTRQDELDALARIHERRDP